MRALKKIDSCSGRRICVTEHEGLRQAGRATQADKQKDGKAKPRKMYSVEPPLSLPCWWASVRYAYTHGAGFGVARLYARAKRCKTDWDRGVNSAADHALPDAADDDADADVECWMLNAECRCRSSVELLLVLYRQRGPRTFVADL